MLGSNKTGSSMTNMVDIVANTVSLIVPSTGNTNLRNINDVFIHQTTIASVDETVNATTN